MSARSPLSHRSLPLQVALVYAARASKLVLVDRDAAALTRAAARCESEGLRGVEVQCLTVDVTNFPAVQSMMTQALERFKRLDILVLCAGLGGHHLFDATTDLAIFHKLMDVNFFVSGPRAHSSKGVDYRRFNAPAHASPSASLCWPLSLFPSQGYLHCVRAAYKSLCESQGRLIAVTSFSGEVGLPYRTAYCASKFAVVSVACARMQRSAVSRQLLAGCDVQSNLARSFLDFCVLCCVFCCRRRLLLRHLLGSPSPPLQTGFLESLRSEMSVASPSNCFHITIVCPPTVNTNLRANSLTSGTSSASLPHEKAPGEGAMTVADCAAAIVDAGDRKLRKAFFPMTSWLASYLRPLIPDAMDKLIMARAKL